MLQTLVHIGSCGSHSVPCKVIVPRPGSCDSAFICIPVAKPVPMPYYNSHRTCASPPFVLNHIELECLSFQDFVYISNKPDALPQTTYVACVK